MNLLSQNPVLSDKHNKDLMNRDNVWLQEKLDYDEDGAVSTKQEAGGVLNWKEEE